MTSLMWPCLFVADKQETRLHLALRNRPKFLSFTIFTARRYA